MVIVLAYLSFHCDLITSKNEKLFRFILTNAPTISFFLPLPDGVISPWYKAPAERLGLLANSRPLIEGSATWLSEVIHEKTILNLFYLILI